MQYSTNNIEHTTGIVYDDEIDIKSQEYGAQSQKQ